MSWRRGKAYAQDLRDRVFALADGGLGVTATADQLRVTASYVSKVLSRRRQTGETTARPQRCQMAPKLRIPTKAATHSNLIAATIPI